jgi:hypothetical protein
MRDVAHFHVPRGPVGKLCVLSDLLRTRTWYRHALHVHLVREPPSDGDSAQARRARVGREAARDAALQNYARRSWVDAE